MSEYENALEELVEALRAAEHLKHALMISELDFDAACGDGEYALLQSMLARQALINQTLALSLFVEKYDAAKIEKILDTLTRVDAGAEETDQ